MTYSSASPAPVRRRKTVRKVLVIAVREYLAAVRTKAFILGLLLMPVMMGGSALVQWLAKDVVDTRDKVFVLLNRTSRPELAKAVEEAASRKQDQPHFKVTQEPPGPADADSINRQRFELSERVRKEELFGFLEIMSSEAPEAGRTQLMAQAIAAQGIVPLGTASPVIAHGFVSLGIAGLDASTLAPEAAEQKSKGGPAAAVILRYQSNRPSYEAFAKLAEAAVAKQLVDDVVEKAKLSKVQEKTLRHPVALESLELSKRDPITGLIIEAPEQNRAAAFLVPAGMMLLMFMVVLMSATPLMQGVVEEKMQRIAEVLLGSVRPFALMLGKLLGMAAVSLTIAAVYLGGTFWVAVLFGVAEMVGYDLLAWFIVLQVLAALMYGSLFIAIGAACTDMKETQNLMWPVMLLAVISLFVLGSVVQEPNSPLVTGLSFFPFATPMLMIARHAVPPGIPVWQLLVGVLVVLATTLLCVYVAGRIFRVGLLLQGKGANFAQMFRWALRG
jgi:ABC-type Na+ efflux pump permease subunit